MSDIAEGDDTALKRSVSPQSDNAVSDVDNAEEPAEQDYSAMTAAELKAIAKSRGLTGYSTMNKAELIALLSDS